MKNLIGEEVRSSVGAGFVVRTPIGRIELNYAVPLRTFGFDRTKNVELGIIFKY